MPLPYQPWRASYLPASYGAAEFHVEVDSQAGGRRNALHEFPHRDEPWTEDMGRRARHWPIVGYVIGPDYMGFRDALISACEQEGPLTLQHPTFGTVQANCDEYVASERRELGGYCIFEMRFVEAGSQPGLNVAADTQSQVGGAADTSDASAASTLNTDTGGSGGIGSDTVAAMRGSASQGPGGIGSDTVASMRASSPSAGQGTISI